jgi:hypothetical protein
MLPRFSGILFSLMWSSVGYLFFQWQTESIGFKWSFIAICSGMAIWGLASAKGIYLEWNEHYISEKNEAIEKKAREKRRKEHLKVSRAKIEAKRQAGTLDI